MKWNYEFDSCGASNGYNDAFVIKDQDGNTIASVTIPNANNIVAQGSNITAELERLRDIANVHAKAIAAIPDMLEALRFYANSENWRDIETSIGHFPADAFDYGATAHAALFQATVQS